MGTVTARVAEAILVEMRYTLTMDDYVAFSRHVLRKSGTGWTGYLIGWVLGPLLFAGWALALRQLGGRYENLAIALAGAGVYSALLYPFVHRSWVDQRIRDFARSMGVDRLLGETTLIFTEESLFQIDEIVRAEVKWNCVDRVEEVGNITYIFLTQCSAWIIPRAAFDDEATYFAARDFAFRKLGDRAEA